MIDLPLNYRLTFRSSNGQLSYWFDVNQCIVNKWNLIWTVGNLNNKHDKKIKSLFGSLKNWCENDYDTL